MRDGASVNNVAMRVFKVVYTNVMDVRCFSHLLNLVGNKFNAPTLASLVPVCFVFTQPQDPNVVEVKNSQIYG